MNDLARKLEKIYMNQTHGIANYGKHIAKAVEKCTDSVFKKKSHGGVPDCISGKHYFCGKWTISER